MKTKKLFLFVAFISIATVALSQTFSENHPFSVKITLRCAMENPALVKVMHEQLNTDFLHMGNDTHFFTATVRLRGTRYLVTGTYDEWMYFFSAALIDPVPEG
jgi:hypothetical protein